MRGITALMIIVFLELAACSQGEKGEMHDGEDTLTAEADADEDTLTAEADERGDLEITPDQNYFSGCTVTHTTPCADCASESMATACCTNDDYTETLCNQVAYDLCHLCAEGQKAYGVRINKCSSTSEASCECQGWCPVD